MHSDQKFHKGLFYAFKQFPLKTMAYLKGNTPKTLSWPSNQLSTFIYFQKCFRNNLKPKAESCTAYKMAKLVRRQRYMRLPFLLDLCAMEAEYFEPEY